MKNRLGYNEPHANSEMQRGQGFCKMALHKYVSVWENNCQFGKGCSVCSISVPTKDLF